MKVRLKIISILLVVLIFARSGLTYSYFINPEKYSKCEQRIPTFDDPQKFAAFISSDRVKLLDNTQTQKNKQLNIGNEITKNFAEKFTLIIHIQVKSFTRIITNQHIFKNYYITFPFHNFY